MRERQSIHCPLPFLGPSSLVVKLHHLSSVAARDIDRGIGALRVNDINFAHLPEGLETARQVRGFVSNGNDDRNGDLGRGICSYFMGQSLFFEFLHSGVQDISEILLTPAVQYE